jgi:hypothetical protein
MRHHAFVFVLTALFLAGLADTASAQLEYDTPVKKATRTRPKTTPKKPVAAKVVTNGVLYLSTEPPDLKVEIRKNGKPVRSAAAVDGELQVELPRGEYELALSANRYQPEARKVVITAKKPTIEDVELTPTTGSIVIGPVDADYVVTIDGQTPAVSDVKFIKERNQVQILNLPVGERVVRITHASIAPKEVRVPVEGGAETNVTPKFQPAIVNLTVTGEPGAQVYIDNAFRGNVADSGKTGVLTIPPGSHTIRLVKSEFDPAEKTQSFEPGDASVTISMTRVKFSDEYADFFTDGGAFWEKPATWKLEKGKMNVRGPGFGFRTEPYNRYKDFKMEFDVRFLNGKGAVWVLRAQDSKNYYVFQLCGPKSGTAKTFRTYICRDGALKLLKSDTIADDISNPNEVFHLVVEAKGGMIRHSLQLLSAPKADGPQPLSVLTDTTFSFGNIGFGTLDGEEAVVLSVVTSPF